MAKWFGKVGYSETVETAPGVYMPQDTVRQYYGDVNRSNTRWASDSTSVNDDLAVNCQISIMADPFANDKFYSIKWIEFGGVKWKVTAVEPQPPRLLLTLGGVWNG